MARRFSAGTSGLTDRQRRFVDEYLVDLNIQAAAMRCGYSASTARSPPKLFNAAVSEAIEAAMAARAERTRVTADRVVAELAKLAFANMLDFIDVGDDGLPRIDLTALTREDGAAIQSLTVDYWRPQVVRKRDRRPGEGIERRRADQPQSVRRVRIQLADKRAALMDLASHLGIAWPGQGAALPEPEPEEPERRACRIITGVPRHDRPAERGILWIQEAGRWRNATREEEAADWEERVRTGNVPVLPSSSPGA